MDRARPTHNRAAWCVYVLTAAVAVTSTWSSVAMSADLIEYGLLQGE